MIEHPLVPKISDLSDDELDKKYNELSRRWQIAKRMGMDEDVLHQLDIMLNSLENEKYNRMQFPEDNKTIVIDTDPIETQTKDSK